MPHTKHFAVSLSFLLLGLLAACSSEEKKAADDADAASDVSSQPDSVTDTRADTQPDAPDVSNEVQPPTFQERQRPGRWLAGDFHVHATGASNDAGDESTPQRIKEVAIERGLDFVVLTDHSNSTGSDTTTRDEDPTLFNLGPEFPYWELAAELSDANFLMVDGNEMSPVNDDISLPTGHVGCIPRSLTDFDPDIAFIDRPRSQVTGAQTLEQGNDAGCFTIVNHPFGPTSWISWDWTSRDYDAIEVWNGGAGFNRFDREAIDAWACDISQGKQTTAIAGSDNHRANIEPPGTLLDPALGVPTTYVWSTALDWDEIVPNLDTGHITISDTGTPMEVDIYDVHGQWLAMIGESFEASAASWLRVQGSLHDGANGSRRLKILAIAPGRCEDTRAPGEIKVPDPNLEVVHDQVIEPDTTFDIAIPLDAASGHSYFVLLSPERPGLQERGVSISNALHAR